MSRVRVLAALAVLAAAASAQTARPLANGATRPRTPAPTAQPRLSDAQLEANIRAKLAKSQKISQDHFQVHVQGGVATIEGKTGVIQHKGSATRMAKSAGALAVNNHIQISDAAKQKAAANLETGRRRAQIKRGDARGDTRNDPHQPR
jgi:osmotically-inducible protein OsmY